MKKYNIKNYVRYKEDLKRVIESVKQKRFVDYNPEVIRDLIKRKIPAIYGHIGDLEIINRLNLKEIELIVSTAPDKKNSMLLTKKAKQANPNCIVIVTSLDVDDALDLYEAGADYVILPHFIGGERVGLLIEETKGNIKKIIEQKVKHLKELKHRKRIGHRHPGRWH